jgi:hypothetical protein
MDLTIDFRVIITLLYLYQAQNPRKKLSESKDIAARCLTAVGLPLPVKDAGAGSGDRQVTSPDRSTHNSPSSIMHPVL